MAASWADRADRVLAPLFARGVPTREQLRVAYPFGERAMWPYKAWLARVKAWRAAKARGQSQPQPARRERARTNDPAQKSLLGVTGEGE